uniref:inosine/xanthosine triphosphatase n=1 Tax=Noctiluca scintillans TaxID=2966 RepID=A0A7S1EZA5_NOCSC
MPGAPKGDSDPVTRSSDVPASTPGPKHPPLGGAVPPPLATTATGALTQPPSCERRCRVVVASTTELKLAAVGRIFSRCSVEGVRVSSGVHEQPFGQEEIILGATNRLKAAKASKPGADYYVSMENGLSRAFVPSGGLGQDASTLLEEKHFDVGWVVLERADGARASVPSAGVELPAADVAVAREAGFGKKTVSSVIGQRVGLLDPENPHAWLTAGRRDRGALLGEAIAVALGQLERVSRGQPFPERSLPETMPRNTVKS